MNRKPGVYQYSAKALASRPPVEGYTIDDISTQDMDDGLWVERIGNQWRVLVSIADVSALVLPGSKADRYARQQGFTLYNPRGNRPMLPDVLDRDRLSLVEGAPRPAVTVEAVLDDNLNILESGIYRSAFFNRKKLSYETYLELSGDPGHRFFLWSQLADKMYKRRRDDGSLTLADLNAAGLRVREDGQVQGNANENHRGYLFVQEMAIFANRVVADYMRRNHIPTLFRNHAADGVDPELGPRLMYDIRDAIMKGSDEDYKTAVRRLRLWFQRARYETDVKGHFGLALPEYLHFTSPIRRYADLVVHRNLMAHIEGRPIVHTTDELAVLGTHLNARNDAERDLHQSEIYKEMLYRRMQRRVRAGSAVFNNLHDEELRMALFVAHYEGIENRHLGAEIRRRADRGVLGGAVVEYLLSDAVCSDRGYWHDMRIACTKQESNTGQGRLMRTFARSVLDWVPAHLEPRSSPSPNFVYVPM